MKCETQIDKHDTSMGQRKKINAQQELNSWPPEHQVGTLSTELHVYVQELMESKLLVSALSKSLWVVISKKMNFSVPCLCHVDQFAF